MRLALNSHSSLTTRQREDAHKFKPVRVAGLQRGESAFNIVGDADLVAVAIGDDVDAAWRYAGDGWTAGPCAFACGRREVVDGAEHDNCDDAPNERLADIALGEGVVQAEADHGASEDRLPILDADAEHDEDDYPGDDAVHCVGHPFERCDLRELSHGSAATLRGSQAQRWAQTHESRHPCE